MSYKIQYEHLQQKLYTWDQQKRPSECSIPHMHREIEIFLCQEGGTAYVDSVRYDLQTGDALLIFPGQIHRYETIQMDSSRLLLVDRDLIPELAGTFESSVPTSAVIRGAGNDPRIRTLSDALSDLREPTCTVPYRSTLLHGYLEALLSELLSRMELKNASGTDLDAMHAIVAFCSEHYSQDLSLTVLEENLCLSRYYISHLLGAKLGLRFNDYINSLRISDACRRLACSDESMTEISDRVGFNTLRTFNRAFVKQMNVSPSDYRRIYRNQKKNFN